MNRSGVRLSSHTKSMRVLLLILGLAIAPTGFAQPMERVGLGSDGKSFVMLPSGKAFVPRGFNYDHDEKGRLIEDYWETEWAKVEEDFAEMAGLGANVVRIHLQFGKFMDSAEQANEKQLDRLRRLLDLAERVGLYIDLTGLGCYHKADVPVWYDALDEKSRWRAQANFWEAVAAVGSESPAMFFYDLMNEPVVPGAPRKAGDWLGPGFGDKHFVQFISLDPAGRERDQIAKEWTRMLVQAVRRSDPKRLVTIGLVPWSLDRPGLTSGFIPKTIAPELDLLCVHLYPESDKLDEARETLDGFVEAGKPVVIEETFPLKCSAEQLETFLRETEGVAQGWIGFYWGATLEDLTPPKDIGQALTRGWLEAFERLLKP